MGRKTWSCSVNRLEPFINLSSIAAGPAIMGTDSLRCIWLIVFDLGGTPEWIRTTDLLLRREKLDVYAIDSTACQVRL